ncbi:hypothetical protein BC830DRAFT_1105125, partial [Chytriomyces sp. MP71]
MILWRIPSAFFCLSRARTYRISLRDDCPSVAYAKERRVSKACARLNRVSNRCHERSLCLTPVLQGDAVGLQMHRGFLSDEPPIFADDGTTKAAV